LLGQEYWSKQVEIAESVRDHQRTTVRSCNGSGKTAAAGRLVIPWWLSAYPRSRVIFTGPTGRQLQNVWIEFTRAARASRGLLAPSQPVKTSPHYEYRIGEDWFAQGFSTNEAERFAGHHEERILFIVDEASGVGEPIFEAIEGSLNTPGAHLLLIGNPTQIGGTFHRSCTTDRALYNAIHIGRDDLPWATGEAVSERLAANLSSEEWCEQRRRTWGEASPLYQVRVLGEFPSSADDSVISLGDLERAQSVQLVDGYEPDMGRPVEVSCDVARFGSDETVIAVRHGWHCRIEATYQGVDLMESALAAA
jgi:phage terminase large subunit